MGQSITLNFGLTRFFKVFGVNNLVLIKDCADGKRISKMPKASIDECIGGYLVNQNAPFQLWCCNQKGRYLDDQAPIKRPQIHSQHGPIYELHSIRLVDNKCLFLTSVIEQGKNPTSREFSLIDLYCRIGKPSRIKHLVRKARQKIKAPS